MRVLGAVARPPERVVYLPVREFNQVKCVGWRVRRRGAGAVVADIYIAAAGAVGGVPGEQVFLRGGSTRPSARPRVPPRAAPPSSWPGNSERVRVTSPVSGSARRRGAAAEAELTPAAWTRACSCGGELLVVGGGGGAGRGVVQDAVTARPPPQAAVGVFADGLTEPQVRCPEVGAGPGLWQGVTDRSSSASPRGSAVRNELHGPAGPAGPRSDSLTRRPSGRSSSQETGLHHRQSAGPPRRGR